MKTHKKHKLAIFGSIFILAIIVLGSTSDFNDPITNSVAFEITSPSIDTFTGTVIEVSGTVCFAKTQTSLIDLRSDGTIGGIIESSNSPFLIDNPQFTLNELNSATTGETIDQIGHFLKIRCETGFTEGQGNPSGATEQNQIACEDPARSSECTAANTTPIQFRPSSIEVEIWAEDKNGLDKRVFGPRAYTTETVILLHGNEEILLFEQIDIDQVLQKMDTGDYSTDVTVKTSGILNLAFEGTNETFQYYIGKTHVPTTFDLKVTDNSAGTETESDPEGFEDINKTNEEQQEEEQVLDDIETQKNKKTQNIGDSDDPDKDPEDEPKGFFDILVQLWIAILNLFKTS